MPVIQSGGGVVVAWSGVHVGPVPEYEPTGKRSPWVRYEAEIGSGSPETAKVIVRVEESWRKLVPDIALSIETMERQIVTRCIEERVTGNYQPLTSGTTNNFNILEQQMLERYRKQRDGNGERKI